MIQIGYKNSLYYIIRIESGWRYDNEIVIFINSYKYQPQIKTVFNDLFETMVKTKCLIIIRSFYVLVKYQIITLTYYGNYLQWFT